MGEHAGKGACGASMQGGLYRGPLGRTLLRREDTSLPVVAARIQPTVRTTLCTTHACPTHAAWRRGAAGDAHSLVAATHAHGEASALHPRRDHPLRASLRKLGGDACLAAPLVCGHAAARCDLRVRCCWCLQASRPCPLRRSRDGRGVLLAPCARAAVAPGRCLRVGRRPPPSGVPPFEGGSMTSKGCHCEYAGCPVTHSAYATGLDA